MRELGRPKETDRESGREAGDLLSRLAGDRGFPRTGTGLDPNQAGQPLGCSYVLPADGSVCMGTKVMTAPGITGGRFSRLESRKSTTVPSVKVLADSTTLVSC